MYAVKSFNFLLYHCLSVILDLIFNYDFYCHNHVCQIIYEFIKLILETVMISLNEIYENDVLMIMFIYITVYKDFIINNSYCFKIKYEHKIL